MPTQEEINAAQVELDIANDNYAIMARRYNKFRELFEVYRNASPEIQAKAAPAMQNALQEYEQLRLNMYAAEDRINVAQNKVNEYNEIIANYQTQQPVVRRRPVVVQNPNGTVTETIVEEVVTPDNTVNPENTIVTPDVIAEQTQTENPYEGLTGKQTILTPDGLITVVNGQVVNTQTGGNINTFGPIPLNGVTGNPTELITSNGTGTLTNGTGGSNGTIKTWNDLSFNQNNNTVNPSAGTRRKVVITPSSNPIDRIKGTYNMGVGGVKTLYNAGQARAGYNQMTDWNGLSGLRGNVQGGAKMLNGALGTVQGAAQFNKGLNQFQGNY